MSAFCFSLGRELFGQCDGHCGCFLLFFVLFLQAGGYGRSQPPNDSSRRRGVAGLGFSVPRLPLRRAHEWKHGWGIFFFRAPRGRKGGCTIVTGAAVWTYHAPPPGHLAGGRFSGKRLARHSYLQVGGRDGVGVRSDLTRLSIEREIGIATATCYVSSGILFHGRRRTCGRCDSALSSSLLAARAVE